MSKGRASIGHVRAMLSAFGIVLYFAVATVWLPSALLRSQLLIGVDRGVSDLITLVVWGTGVGIGMWGLRLAQKRGWI